jgi:hypothetical protein
MTDIYLKSAAQLIRDGYVEAGYSILRLALYEAIARYDDRVLEITGIMMDVRASINGG